VLLAESSNVVASRMFGNGDGTEGGPSASTCTAWMRSHCAADMQKRSMMMSAGPPAGINQTLAAFLVTRPPCAYQHSGHEPTPLAAASDEAARCE
jgi:hypothetical protein